MIPRCPQGCPAQNFLFWVAFHVSDCVQHLPRCAILSFFLVNQNCFFLWFSPDLVDVSDFFSFCSVRGGGVRGARRGGDRFFIENPRRRGGGVSGRGGAGRVSVANRGILGGGGAKNLFGAETSTKVKRDQAIA